MKIATAWNTGRDTVEAVEAAYQQLLQELGAVPTLLIVYSSVIYDSELLAATLQTLSPNTPILGGTSCLGVMTQMGFHSEAGVGLGLFGIYDPMGDYGVGIAPLAGDPRKAGALAVEQAIENAQRFGELPTLAWVTNIPGHEEATLQGIQDVVGENIPIAGGSVADNTVSGNWQQFALGKVYDDTVIVTVMYPSTPVHYAFHSGYSPIGQTGIVTRASGRTLYEIDGRPAAEVYNEWSQGAISDQLTGGNVLAATSFNPLGRIRGHIGELPFYLLSHPDSVTAEGGLTLFADIEIGEKLYAMEGTRENLINRAGQVAQSALDAGKITAAQISGALIIYCAGCLLTVQDDMDTVARTAHDTLAGKPFLGTFTFGEQGCFVNGKSHHGNLMISVVLFEGAA